MHARRIDEEFVDEVCERCCSRVQCQQHNKWCACEILRGISLLSSQATNRNDAVDGHSAAGEGYWRAAEVVKPEQFVQLLHYCTQFVMIIVH